MPGLSGKTNATKNLSKSSPSSLLLTTDDQERGAKAIRAQKPDLILFYYLFEDERSKYWPSFFHLTTGVGYPLGGEHFRIVSSPTETSVSFGKIRKSSLMSVEKKEKSFSIYQELTDLQPTTRLQKQNLFFCKADFRLFTEEKIDHYKCLPNKSSVINYLTYSF